MDHTQNFKTLKRFCTIIIFLTILGCENKSNSNVSQDDHSRDIKYISSGLNNIKSQNQSRTIQLEILKKIEKRIDRLNNGKLKNKYQLKLSYHYLILEDSLNFRRSNQIARSLAEKLEDSSAVAASFWDLGDFLQSRNIKDSAYYYYNNSQKIYKALNQDFNTSRLLLNMAIIQKNIKDYTGSEVTTTEAIRLLKPLEKYKQLYSAYNNLGIIYNELENYEKSLIYYKKAESYLRSTNKTDLFPSLWNNIGIIYNNSGDYKTASNYYSRALSFNDSIVKNDGKLYAMLLDNYSYNRIKAKDTNGVLPVFKYSLNIRDSLNLLAGQIINKIHLAEYYVLIKDTSTAISYLKKAKAQAIESQNTRDVLSSLKLLAEISGNNSLKYANEYIDLSDSLYKEERETRNKFTRIRFETDEYISKSQKLSEKVTQISLIGVTVLLFISIVYIIFFIRLRNKELRLIKQRQNANIEIYNLTLAQKKNYEAGKEREKHRMSRELHDGVLGKLFGIRLSLDSLNDQINEEAVRKRKRYIQELKVISEEIRSISHELSLSETYEVNFQTLILEFIDQVKEQNENIFFDFYMEKSIPWKSVEDEVKMNYYKILQETIFNIQKHAHANKVLIRFDLFGKILTLTVTDNGIGFNKMNSENGIGIRNMHSRAKSINSNLSISNNAQGTTVCLEHQIT